MKETVQYSILEYFNTLLNCFFQFTSYSRAYMPVCTHKQRHSVKFSLDLSIGKKLKRAIDRQTVIRISESGKLLLVESGIQGFFSWNPESWALEFDDWNPESPAWTPESKSVLSCVFCLISSIQQSFAASGNYNVQGLND